MHGAEKNNYHGFLRKLRIFYFQGEIIGFYRLYIFMCYLFKNTVSSLDGIQV